MKNIDIKKICCALLLFISLPILNCNRYTYKMIYNNLDFILYLQVDKYFTPDEKQKEFAKQKLAALLKWNRETALPRYKELLVYAKNAVEKGITEKDIDYIYDKYDKEIEIIAEKAAPDAAEFALTLNNKQIENFREKVNTHKKEEEEKEASRQEDPMVRTVKSRIKFLSNFYGSFSTEQTEKIQDYLKNINYPEYNRWGYQNIKQSEFIELVNKKADEETLSGFIRNWITREDNSLPESYRENVLAQRKFNTGLYIYVDKNIVTENQRVNAVNTLNNWILTLDSLQNEK